MSLLIEVRGFGAEYKGVLPNTGTEVAIKRIMRSPMQGMREFVAKIERLGRLRHKNLRFNILKGVATGLLYLHEEWEQVVIHRDVKSSNILIDGEFNARLGDFGLARLYSHDQFLLVDWVLENCQLGQILRVVDPKLGSVYDEEEVELVLKLGLLCSQYKVDYRPSMKQMARYLHFDDPLLDISYWRYCDSQSSTTSLSFSKAMSTRKIASSYSLSSIGSRNTMPIKTGREHKIIIVLRKKDCVLRHLYQTCAKTKIMSDIEQSLLSNSFRGQPISSSFNGIDGAMTLNNHVDVESLHKKKV
ncbi:hypothetical protein JHK85_001570 [Glycine max]|nr:hypothetical protein JHK85_001570 [Glycine max]